METIRIEIFTPYAKYLEDEIRLLSIFSDGYSMGVLPNHYPLITTLKLSKLKLVFENEEFLYSIGEGVMHVEKGVISMLVDFIERGDEIDIGRAKAKEEEMLSKLETEENEDLIKTYKKSLKKARTRIAVYEEFNKWFM